MVRIRIVKTGQCQCRLPLGDYTLTKLQFFTSNRIILAGFTSKGDRIVGSPAKIIGVKFSIDQIIEHEKVLYSEEKRLSRDYLEELFKQYYSNVRIFGVTTDFTPEHIERLKLCARKRKFTKKDYFEKLSNLNKNV